MISSKRQKIECPLDTLGVVPFFAVVTITLVDRERRATESNRKSGA